MPFYGGFTSGLSALRAQSVAFDTIRGNIENQTVPGYKAADVRFADLVGTKTPVQNSEQLLGVQPFQQVFVEKSGQIIPTENRFDAAMVGSGFFVTRTSFDASGDIELTDSGFFNEALIEENGEERVFLTDFKGNYLLGYNADPVTGVLNVDTSSVAALEPIEVTRERALSTATATSFLSVAGNLAPDTPVGETESFNFTVLDGSGLADGVADERLLTLSFEKAAETDEWDMTISGENGVVSAAGGQPIRVVFGADGQIESLGGSTTPTLDFGVTWAEPAATNAITLNLRNFQQAAGLSGIERVDNDGNTEGLLTDVFFGENGYVVGSFSNGITRPIAQVALGDVVAPNRLAVLNDNHFRLTTNSGPLDLYDLTQTGRAKFQPGALEESTTEVTKEFSNLIVTQRAYSSAATAVRTVDEMLQTANRMKS
ncbi:MAG: flagellar hook-basal body complex protein [Alphaproteobacteria bacterium]|nr:flagellar hook-basal body complex protein [Alphaproteobacteria bacterium]